ncbi:relaxase/mobilization nuclease domain-containing protein [Kitasatospora sp. NPDC058478]|uniref:relaxase/mobilization nuclease domain-containing protein n=1 Tax=unclassified Kitasatospora TaxID=2633591 RepID=UPI00365690E2
MISKAVHGNNTLGALRYLFGPGKANEHTDPHVVASWDGFAPDPGRHQSATLEQLTDALDLHVVQYGRKINNHVYHRMIRADPGDRILSDDDWAAIARRVMAAAGIAPDGDEGACRWVAVRHADDHVHILATVVRADLTQARLRGDQYRVEAELTKIEREYKLKDLSDTRTREYRDAIPKRAKGTELYKAQRLGQEGTDRDRLRTAVRQALAGAADEEDFTARLAAKGVLLAVRRAPSGDVTGYKFALPPAMRAGRSGSPAASSPPTSPSRRSRPASPSASTSPPSPRPTPAPGPLTAATGPAPPSNAPTRPSTTTRTSPARRL